MIGGFVLLSAALAGVFPNDNGSLLSRADEAYWKEQARLIVASAALAAGGASGSYRNTTPYDLRVPGGNMGYPAFWVRDAAMMLGGDFVPAREIEGWIRLIAATVPGPADWTVRPGVIVPAYSIADHINFDGKPVFYPGIYDSGAKQGGPPWGKYPPLDDAYYFIGMVYDHWRATGSLDLFRSAVKTAFGEERLDDLCRKVYAVPSFDPATGLIVAGDVETENAKDWGFCDAESKSGKLLFPSALKFVAAERLGEMFAASGRPDRARVFRDEAVRLRSEVTTAFFRPSADGAEGWLRSATGVGDQADVWGTAYAVAVGAVDERGAGRAALALRRAYAEKTAVREGCVRQILTTDTAYGGGWQISIVKPGEYQNGGYWGTPAGWVIAAIARADRPAAARMAADFVGFLKSRRRPDGLPQAWEWFNPDTNQSNNPLYVATVALPYLSLLRAGLLGGASPR